MRETRPRHRTLTLQHSRKHEEFYATIRRVTDGPRTDVFSREPRDGFDQHGNETDWFAVAAE